MKVWVLQRNGYDDQSVEAVFSTKEEAIRYAREEWDIESWEQDSEDFSRSRPKNSYDDSTFQILAFPVQHLVTT